MKKKTDSPDSPKANKTAKKKIRRKLQGVVVSNKMAKTVLVSVQRSGIHGKYKKIIKSSKKYKAHTLDEIAEGSKVIIEECRPISKNKAWKVIKIVEKK